MPEIGEVARIVHYLRKHLTGKRITSVLVQEDDIIYGKVGTSASAFKASMTGKTILDARQQGKYFWLVCDKPPHPVMHLGMTGWMRFSNDDSSYYKPKKEEEHQWPPRFWKFVLQTEGAEACEVAFVDARRLARIRLVDVAAEELRNTSPLKENGPDPVQDKDVLTHDWLVRKMNSKKVPVKALLLDQANISGVGNWVADEILYQARIHPEQYSNTCSDEQLKRLYDSLIYVCTTAVEVLSEQDKFPQDWLMKYRWDNGKKGKDTNVLPNGNKIVHLKVGGRTSAIVPAVQKKTGAVAGDVAGESEHDGDEDDVAAAKPSNGRGRKRKSEAQETSTEEPKSGKRARKTRAKKEGSDDDDEEEHAVPAAEADDTKGKPSKSKSKSKTKAKATATAKSPKSKTPVKNEEPGRRRSARISAG